MPATPPSISGVDFLKKPALLQTQIDLLYAVAGVNVQLVTKQGAQELRPGIASIVGSPPNLILPLPLKFSVPIPDCTADLASLSATLNALLAALRANGQLPA